MSVDGNRNAVDEQDTTKNLSRLWAGEFSENDCCGTRLVPLLNSKGMAQLRKIQKTYCFKVSAIEAFYYATHFILSRPEVIWKRIYTSYIVPETFMFSAENEPLPGFGEEVFIKSLSAKNLDCFLNGTLKKVQFDRALIIDNPNQDIVLFQEYWDFENRTIGYGPKYRTEFRAEEDSYNPFLPLWTSEICLVDIFGHGSYEAHMSLYTLPGDDEGYGVSFLRNIEGLVNQVFETNTLDQWINRNARLANLPTLMCIDRTLYLPTYKSLKYQYYENLTKIWKEWEQRTDSQKDIPEDLHIATYMECLQGNSSSFLKFGKKFVDIGCGNGMLVYLLRELGWTGYGIDLRRRKLWKYFSSQEKRPQFQEINVKYNTILDGVDSDTILIGNHPDELSALIPLLTIHNGAAGFIIIPCCAYDMFGKKCVRERLDLSSYECHVMSLLSMSTSLGFEVTLDKLRIPSTKRVAILGSLNASSKAATEFYENLIRELSTFKCDTPSIRDKELRVNNCSQLPRERCDNIIHRIFLCIYRSRCLTCPSCANIHFHDEYEKLPRWHVGCKNVTIRMLTTSIISEDDRNFIKGQGNDLLTLLRNHSEVFEIKAPFVNLRLPSKGKVETLLADGQVKKLRSKPCLYFQRHPDGCPLEDFECAFDHKIEVLQHLPVPATFFRDGIPTNFPDVVAADKAKHSS